MAILLTGGAGYIGSHMIVDLLSRGEEVYCIDNLSRSTSTVYDKIHEILGDTDKLHQYNIDLSDDSNLPYLITELCNNDIDTVVHFAGYKSVPESVSDPILYYRNNLDCTINLCELCSSVGISNILFSSSSTIYNDIEDIPFREDTAHTSGSSPYGWTKFMSEKIIEDYCKVNNSNCFNLRYFNPVGAHPSGLIGDELEETTSLMPNVILAALGKRDKLYVFGDDYNTKDGTCVRDYIHISDLIDAHVKSVDYLRAHNGIIESLNLGTGSGYTVLEIIKEFENSTGLSVPYEMTCRRDGDTEILIADSTKSNNLLDWTPTRTLADMCLSALNHYYKMKGV